MALTKQTALIDLTNGIQTKNSEEISLPGELKILENVVFRKLGEYNKRAGLMMISDEDLSSQTISNKRSLSTFLNELNLYTNTSFYAYSDSLDKWQRRGNVFTTTSSVFPVIRNTYEQSELDVAVSDNVAAVVWKDSRGDHRVTTYDIESGTKFATDLQIASGVNNARIVALFNKFFIFYVDGTDLKYRTIDLADPSSLNSEVISSSDVNSSSNIFDALTIGDKIFVAYNSTTPSQELSVYTIDQTETKSTVVIFNEDPTESLTLATDSQSRLIVTFADGTDVKIFGLSFNLTTTVVPLTTVETISDVTHTTAVRNSDLTYTVYYEVSATETYNHYIKRASIDNAGNITSAASVFARSVGLAARAFEQDGRAYIPVIHDSTLQSSYFLLDQDASLVTKNSVGFGGDIIPKGSLSAPVRLSDSEIITVAQGTGLISSGRISPLLGGDTVRIRFTNRFNIQDAELGPNLHIAGGVMRMYDGTEIVEHGFNIFPENLSSTNQQNSGGSIDDGTRQYVAVYAWTDNQGLVHRSTPSVPITVTFSGGNAQQRVDIVVPTLRLTEKSGSIVEIYRTEDNGTVFYKITDDTSPLFNDKTVDTVTFTDTISDLDLIDGQLLYTTGGVLENNVAPSAEIITEFRDRIIVASLEERSVIAASKIRADGEPVEFSDFITIQVPTEGGRITGLEVLDDKLIIFKETKIFLISGDGPTNTGQQNTFTEVQEITSDVGCLSPDSIVVMPQGIMFKSQKGIYLLNRGLATAYIGSSVEDFNDLTVSSAVLMSDVNQVRFTTSDGNALVYDYFFQKWTTFTNYEALDSVNINGIYNLLKTDGTLQREDASSHTDNGLPINMALETDWITLGEFQGYKRLYKIMMLNKYHSPHKFRFKMAYDFKEAFTFDAEVDPADFIDATPYGVNTPYGSGSPYGGNGSQYQVQFNMSQQKCQSFKIRFEEKNQDEYGEGLTLVAFSALMGIKGGLYRQEADQKVPFRSRS